MTVNVNDGAAREVFSDLRAAVSGLAWTHDGRGLLMGRRDEANRWHVVRASMESGPVQATTLVTDSVPQSIDVTTDGSRIALSTRRTVWEPRVLDNVLSALK